MSARSGKERAAKGPTPMVRQYQRIKADHPQEILLYRVGDFYETFGDDAKEASEILGITLTKKHIGNGKTLPLAGIPYHALDGYLGRLVRAGRRVAICEQTETPKNAKGPTLAREVVRIVTPGTVIEENLLEDKTHNFLAAAVLWRGVWGLARCDLSTGELAATQFGGEASGGNPSEALADEIARIGPAELLATEEDLARLPKSLKTLVAGGLVETRIDAGLVRQESAEAALREQLCVQNLQGFGVERAPAAAVAAGALVGYLRETQRRVLGHIQHLNLYSSADYLVLDSVTQRSLELVHNLIDGRTNGTLLEVLDSTRTPMGGRLLRHWIVAPLQDMEEIAARQDAIEALVQQPDLAEQIGASLRGVRDLERILSRVHCRTANARDLLALARSLREAPEIAKALDKRGRGSLERVVSAMAKDAAANGELADELERAIHPEPPVTIREGGMIRDGYNEKLDGLREISRGGKSWISKLQKEESERTGIPKLKIGYNRVFGYYIEVTKPNLDKVPESYERRQTLTGAERFVTPELKQKEAEILGAQDRIVELESEIFETLRERVAGRTAEIQRLAAQVAEVDALASLAHAALLGGYVRPEVDGSDVLEIEGGRHPVVEALMSDRPFVPNDVKLDTKHEQIWLITGPNMAGKSTFIRQVALITVLAHMGSFVPARRARVGLVDRVFTRVGATDYLVRGQSTFLVEMTETANILNHATDKSLVILDEIGRGTSTYDGLSIAWAVAEYLHEQKGRRAKTLFATHYHELTDLEGKLARLRNYNVVVKEQGEGITFLYQIQAGGSDHSYGIHAARLAGIPREVVARAREILFELECASPVGEETGLARRPASEPVVLAPQPTETAQLDLFAAEDPIVMALRRLDVMSVTPMQAIHLLDELAKAARERE